jgi:hypothetical protein
VGGLEGERGGGVVHQWLPAQEAYSSVNMAGGERFVLSCNCLSECTAFSPRHAVTVCTLVFGKTGDSPSDDGDDGDDERGYNSIVNRQSPGARSAM